MKRCSPPDAALAPLFLCLALVCVLALCPSAQAAGSRPWLPPGQQDNASAAQANASAPAARADIASPASQSDSPEDAAGKAQFEALRQYFRRQMTLDEDFPEVFSRRVKDSEATAFLSMRQMQRKRGLLARFQAAEVDLSGLTFTRVTNDPDLARIRVTGRYSFTLGPKGQATEGPKGQAAEGLKAQETVEPKVLETLEEDALFVLLPEMGEWKIFERREAWQP